MSVDINLNSLICDNFTDVFCDIVNCDVDRAVLKGGRSSTKSQVTSEAIVVGCMTYNSSAVAAVKYANKIEERLVNTFRESIRYLGVESFWKLKKSPFEYILLDENGKETDISIKFTGCDNPDNLKSFKPRKGSFRYIWFEETTNFSSLKEVNNLIQTFSRGEGKHCIIMTYNPPIQSSNWVNIEYNAPVGKILGHKENQVYTEFEFELNGEKNKVRQVVNHSTYLDVINSGHSNWLGITFIGDAEKMKVENNTQYRWAYMGEVVGTEANVFKNIRDWDGNIDKLNIREIHRGHDWGYGGPDTCAYIEVYYDRVNKALYLLNEYGRPKMEIEEVVDGIRKYNKHNFPVYCDSAVPLLNNQLRNKGINAIDVKKGAGSVRAGVQWLQNLNAVYISPIRTPEAYKEFTRYEYIVDKEDNVTSELPDKNNHFIDAVRYALSVIIKYE